MGPRSALDRDGGDGVDGLDGLGGLLGDLAAILPELEALCLEVELIEFGLRHRRGDEPVLGDDVAVPVGHERVLVVGREAGLQTDDADGTGGGIVADEQGA